MPPAKMANEPTLAAAISARATFSDLPVATHVSVAVSNTSTAAE